MKRLFFIAFILLSLSAVVFTSCRKDRLITDSSAKLEFSTDTLTFDTVFTTLGSSTKLFKIFNPHKQSIEISKIYLAGGEQSQFRMNVDGVPGTQFTDLRIAPEDSMYVFVEVTVDPNAQNLPFVIYDSVMFVTNGNVQDVQLEAYGQNAHFYNSPDGIAFICNETWENDKPYVLLSNVWVDTGCVLTIKEGVRIYVHKDAYLIASGTIEILGTKDTFVNFEGDRLEHFFDDLPGQWGGLLFLRGSKNNVIKYARINEATTGVTVGSSLEPDLSTFTEMNMPDVTMENVIIKNASEYGIFSFFSEVSATNSLIHSIGKNNLSLLFGGKYNFTHVTAANYGTTGFDHKNPVLRLTNYAVQNDVPHIRDLAEANFVNSIIYGNIAMDTSKNAGEVLIDSIGFPGAVFNYQFSHSLLRTNLPVTGTNFTSVLKNINPQFEDITEENYSLTSGSPAINAGDPSVNIILDLYGKMRDGQPDMGAIEHQ